MKKLSLSFMLLLASPTFTANAGLSDWYNSATSYANTAYSYAGQLAGMAKDVAQTTYNAAYQAYENSHISEYATSTYNTVYNWASENISHLSAATKDKARSYLQSKAVDLMGKYTVKLVDKKVDRLLYDLVYKQNGVHVEDAEGNVIGHIYNDNANFLRNFAAKFGVDLNTLVPYIPGQKALWNFLENRFFKLTLLNKTIASQTVQYALGKKIKAATLKAVGAAMGLAESKILDLITSNNMVVTAEEEAQITQLMNVKNSTDATSVEIDGTTIAVDSSSEDLGMLEQAVNHYVSLFKVNFNETVEKIVGTVANLAAAELAEKALNIAETATQTAVGFGATLLNPSYGVIALLSLKADNELNSNDTYSRSIVQWLVGYDARKADLENRSSNFASQMLQKILPNFLQATSTDYDNAYGKLVTTTDGEWEIIGRDASTIVSMSKVVEGIQSSFGNIASGFGESVKNIFGNAVKNLEKVVETGKDIVSTVAEVAENLVEDLPTFGHNIYDAEPGYDEEVQPNLTDKIIAWWYGSK